MPSFLRVADLDRETIDRLILSARAHANSQSAGDPIRAVVGLLFYEDSLRTRTGFQVASARLGAQAVTVFHSKQTPAMSEPESFVDTVRSIGEWCDTLCIRHSDPDAPATAARLARKPVINCGNGPDEHPTQALADLFAMETLMGQVDGLNIAIVGDLRGMRASHSLLLALGNYEGVSVRCISPPGLGMPEAYVRPFQKDGNEFEETTSLTVGGVDVIYVAGLPAQTAEGHLADGDRAAYRISRDLIERSAPRARVLCPLPRVDEIDTALDDHPSSAYFEQSEMAIWMRMAILESALAAPSVRS